MGARLLTGRSATPIRVHQFWDAIDQCSTSLQGAVTFEQIMTIVTSVHKVSRDELDRELEAAVRDKLIVSDVIHNEKHEAKQLYKLPEPEMTKPDHHDWYCFHCHLGAGGPFVGCKDCPRTFHLDCLPDDRKADGDLFICSPCHIMATKPSAELLNLKPKKLNKLLKYSCRRLKDLGIPEVNRADGETWAVASNREAKDKWRYDLLVYFNIDLSKMLKKAEDRDYQSLEEFQVDCETLIHGIRVYFGVEQLEGQSIAASFHTEVMEIIEKIKICHECFLRYYGYEKKDVGPLWFCLPCKIPHQVVWAKVQSDPYWPAKVMKIDGSKYDVIFFGGKHKWGTIDANNVLPIDTPLSSLKIRKTRAWNEAYEELQKFVDIAKNPEKVLPPAKADKYVTPAKSNGTPGKRAASSRIEEKRTKKSKNEVAAQKSQEDIERAEPNVDMNSHCYKLRSKDSPVLDDDYDDNDDDASTNSIPERLKQPPAYINTQLMKIKMEEDYVPVKKESDKNVKQQVKDNNNDNSSSAQSDDEDNHEFRVLGSERGQKEEEVAVEVNKNNATKAVVNETETKEKEEGENNRLHSQSLLSSTTNQDKNLPPAPGTVDPKLAQLTTPKAISSGADGASPMILNSKILSAKTTTTTPVTTVTKETEVIAQIFQTPQGQKLVFKGPTQDMTPQILQQIQAQIASMSGLSNGATFKFLIQSSQTIPNSPTTSNTPSGQKLPLPNAPTNTTPKTRQQNGQQLHKTSDGKIQSGGQGRAAPDNQLEGLAGVLKESIHSIPNMKKLPPSNTTSGSSSSSSSATPEQQQKKSLQQQVHPNNTSHRLGTAPPHPSSSSSSAKNSNLTSQSKQSTESLGLGKTMPQKKLEVGMKEKGYKNKTTAGVVNETEITIRNEDSNTKANLEETINSLSQEKTEIQRTLQNKIDQLNLVNGQQQTNINALNSIITQQWTEINQLKPQMAEQQNKIEELNNKLESALNSQPSVEIVNDLNSRINFQRDENKELKFQLAEQKKKIEELSNKLKSSATSEKQQLAEIHDLNSKIARQRDENKELKSQVAKQTNQIEELNNKLKSVEDEICDLNATITLQQDESNQLKSQVAEQQTQIEELNKKLKSSSQNQQSVENSNPQIQIGDFPKKILSRIFDYLDINSLKESRFVCHQWKREAGKVLLKNFYLVCDDNTKCENALKNWVRNPYTIPASTAVHKLWSKYKYDSSQRTLKLLKKFPWLRNSVKELKYDEGHTGNVYEILHQLPNLQELRMLIWDLSPLQNWLKEERSLNNGNSNKLQWLVQKLQTLKKLKLIFGHMSEEDATHFFRHGQQFSSIKNLELHVFGMDFIENFMKHSLYNWSITRCILNVEKNYNVGVIRRFLMRISPSLQHLKFTFTLGSPEVNSLSVSEPWTDDWIIPLGLNRVETLEIQLSFAKEELVVNCLLAALQLPRLKKLGFSFFKLEKDFKVTVHKWNSHESARGRKLTSESIEELELFPTISVPPLPPNPKKIPGLCWPRLKSLKCSWKSPACFDPSVLSEVKNLERLELIIIPHSTYQSIPYQSGFQLRDLKCLKSFHLKVPENRPFYQDFANGLVQSDLKFMKSLQYVQFHRVIIDTEPLGPNVPIIFIK